MTVILYDIASQQKMFEPQSKQRPYLFNSFNMCIKAFSSHTNQIKEYFM